MEPESLALSLGLACFTLPFLVFAAPAGYLADRFSKRNVMVACKAAEIVVIGLGLGAILLGNVPLMFVMLFILGGQATMFITSKLGAIPEIVRSRQNCGGQRADQHGLDGGHHHRLGGGQLALCPDQARRPGTLVAFGLGLVGRGHLRTAHQPVDRPAASRPIRPGQSPGIRPGRPSATSARSGRSGRCFWRPWAAPISGRSARCRKSTSISSPRNICS